VNAIRPPRDHAGAEAIGARNFAEKNMPTVPPLWSTWATINPRDSMFGVNS
jgi:hypothetical protein